MFGSHKTWKGLVLGIIAAVIVAGLQKLLFPMFWLENWLLVGFLLGAGALGGDLVKSGFKRKAGIAPGKSWIPFDQLDFVVGALLAGSVVFIPEASVVISVLILTFFLHILVNHIAFFLGIRKEKW